MQTRIGHCGTDVEANRFAMRIAKSQDESTQSRFHSGLQTHVSNSIRRLEMEETTKKLAMVVIFLSVVVVTLFGLAPAI